MAMALPYGAVDSAAPRRLAARASPSFSCQPDCESSMPIPRTLHFCWIGPSLSWAHGFALLSAAAQGGMDDVILHHTDELADGPVLRALQATPGLRLERRV